MRKLFLLLLGFQFVLSSAYGQLQLRIITKNAMGAAISKVEVADYSQRQSLELPYDEVLDFRFDKAPIDVYDLSFVMGNTAIRRQMLLNNGSVTIKGTLRDGKFDIDTVINSPKYYESLAYYDSLKAFSGTTDTTALNKFLLNTIERNVHNVFSILVAHTFIIYNQNSVDNIRELKKLLDKQGGKLNWFLSSQIMHKRVKGILSTANFDISKYRFTDTSGRLVRANLKGGGYFVLDLWFVNCPPCVQQHGQIKDLYPELLKKNIQVIGISTDADGAKWKQYLAQHKDYTWMNLREHTRKKMTDDLSIVAFPTYMILDEHGKLLRTYNSFDSVLGFFSISGK